MTLPTSGALSLNDIKGEFGGPSSPSLGNYYAGGGYVPAGTSGTYGAVPNAGTISIQNFYGTSNTPPFTPITNTYGAGSGSETVPTGATSLTITAYGTGGSGGYGYDASGVGDGPFYGGGGGGSGALVVRTISVSSGDYGGSVSWTVPAGGYGSGGNTTATGSLTAGSISVSAGGGASGGSGYPTGG